jgi:general L-amino acid transport system permease protein
MATATETIKPPVVSIGVLGWLRKNLFNTWYNALLTFFALWVIYSVLTGVWGFIIGADWTVITTNLRLFMVGRYTLDQVWRVQLSISIAITLMGASWSVWHGLARTLGIAVGALLFTLALLPFASNDRLWLAANFGLLALGFGIGYVGHSRRLITLAWLLSLPLTAVLLYGVDGLPRVATDLWGGLLLTLALAIVGIATSFPLGVLLAVGRQSSYPVIRAFCILYIELVRGVPLVTIIFMMQRMLPLFLPEGLTVESVVRAMVGFTLFTAAYLAETVRGGLQAIGRGQSEAARALGLSGLQTLWLIILPQALRAVIPAIVGQFISLFKDTSLVAIVGLLDLAGIAQSAVSQSAFLGRNLEVYVFIAALYWVGASSMSYASRRLERSLGVGVR